MTLDTPGYFLDCAESRLRVIFVAARRPEWAVLFQRKERYHGPTRLLEGLSEAFPGVVPDRPLSGIVELGAGIVPSHQQEDGKPPEAAARRLGNRRSGREGRCRPWL